MPPQDPLAQLRDIHLPEAISWWPPANGWWLLAVLLLLALLYAAAKWRTSYQHNTYRRQAVGELEQAWKQFKGNGDGLAYIKLCNIVLRRAALHRDTINRRAIAPLAGQEWFDYLDSCCKKPVFADTISPDIYDAHYRPSDENETRKELRELHKAALRWLKIHP